MQSRIKELRKSLGLNQSEFAEKIGMVPSAISNYEAGTRVPSDAIIKSICREFGVNETWLRTGAGDMFAARTREAELGELITTRLYNRPESFQTALITTLLRFDPDGPEWSALEKIVKSLQEETKKDREH